MNRIERAVLEYIELEYAVRGDGEPVVLVHAGIFCHSNSGNLALQFALDAPESVQPLRRRGATGAHTSGLRAWSQNSQFGS